MQIDPDHVLLQLSQTLDLVIAGLSPVMVDIKHC